MNSVVTALSREPRGLVFLTNLTNALEAGFVKARKASFLLQVIESVDAPSASAALGIAMTKVDPSDGRRINQEQCAKTVSGSINRGQFFATVQRAKFFGELYETLPENQKASLERLARLIRQFDALEAADRKRAALKKILSEIEILSKGELGDGQGLLRLNPSGSPFGGSARVAPSWFTFLSDDDVSSCIWNGGTQVSPECAEDLRNLLGLVHHGSNPALSQPGFVPQLICLYCIHGHEVPQGFKFDRPTVLHGDGPRFQQVWTEDPTVDEAAYGHAVDLKKFHFDQLPPIGGPEVTIENWDWPEANNEIRFSVIGTPTLENKDWMPVGDDKFASYLASGQTVEMICERLEKALAS